MPGVQGGRCACKRSLSCTDIGASAHARYELYKRATTVGGFGVFFFFRAFFFGAVPPSAGADCEANISARAAAMAAARREKKSSLAR